MSEREVSQLIECDGPLAYEINGSEPATDVFRALWESATDFGIVNSSVPVIGVSSGKEKKLKVRRRFESLPLLLHAMTKAWWVRIWPGTNSSKADRLLVLGKTKGIDFDEFFAKSQSLFWEGPGAWDDLMLFSKGKLIFFVCTHDKFGYVFGNDVRFKQLNLVGASTNKLANLDFRGVNIDINFLRNEMRTPTAAYAGAAANTMNGKCGCAE